MLRGQVCARGGAGSVHSLASEFQKGRIPWARLWDNVLMNEEKENYGIRLLGS